VKATRSVRRHGARLRLGADFHVWDDLYQGSRSHLLGLYCSAIELAPDIDFFFFLDDTVGLKRAHVQFSAPNVTLVRMRRRSGAIRLALQMPWLQWRHSLDLLHMQYKLPLVRAGAYACTIHDVLFETHPMYFEPAFARQMRRFCSQAAHRSALLMTVSDYSRKQIASQYGLDEQAIQVTHNAVDPQRFYPGSDGVDVVESLGLAPRGYILTVGRLEPRKNHTRLLEAYATLGAEAPPLVIVGQRDFRYDAVFTTLAGLRLQAKVKLFESIGDLQLPALFRHARCFAYPTHAEGFGMPVLEAMASGVPVITSNTTSIPEVAGQAALLVDPDDVASLANGLRRLLDDDTLARSLSVGGIAQARTFSWARSARTLIEGVRAAREPRAPVLPKPI
jgi:glycosyltransferase involved in cell wall biosynthesis